MYLSTSYILTQVEDDDTATIKLVTPSTNARIGLPAAFIKNSFKARGSNNSPFDLSHQTIHRVYM